MVNIIIILIIVLIVIYACRSSMQHFKGEGGCCGGSTTVKMPKVKKKLKEPIIGEAYITVSGMHCNNCRNNLEASLNKIEGVKAIVELKTQTAKLKFSRKVEDVDLIAAIEEVGFQVEEIKR